MLDFRSAMREISWRAWVLVLLSSVLQIMCFPIAGPVPGWRAALCWVALMPLLAALIREDSAGRKAGLLDGAALGYVSGIFWYLGNCYWIYATMHTYGGIARPAAAGILLLFSLYLGLYHALFGVLVTVFHRGLSARKALLLSPFAWVAVELARARITGFPWDLLGIAQVDNPLLTRLAPLTGSYGLSFIIAAVNALWLMRVSIRERRHTRTALTAAGVGLVLLCVISLRQVRVHREMGEGGVATLVQENLEVGAPATAAGSVPTQSEMLQSFSALSLFPPMVDACDGIPEVPSTHCGKPAAGGPARNSGLLLPANLVVWPEAPNNFLESDNEFRRSISQLARVARAPVIAGSIGVTPDPADARGYLIHNSAEFIAADGSIAGRYDKMHLVPFGEYVPFKNLFFFAGSLLQDVGVFDPGKERTMFTAGGHTYGTFICYESVFSDEIREYARRGAEVLVNISDDGWYGDTSAAWEHLNQVRMRAIENHRWILRATNTGVTAVINPYGRVTAAVPRHTRTSLRAAFGYERDITFYAAHGDVFAWFCVLVTLAGVGWSLTAARNPAR
jgi:apolipoprotein N-acyltransferase